MTTLPQTSIRLPRPPSAVQPLGVPGAAPAGLLAASAAPQLTGADIWRVLRANMWLILSFVVLSVIAGYVTFKLLNRYFPEYLATGIVQVSPPININPVKTVDERPDINLIFAEQRKYADLLKSENLFAQVLRKEHSPIQDTSWRTRYTTAEAIRELKDNLIVTPSIDTSVIRVSIATRFSQDSVKIVQSVVDTLIDQQTTRNNQEQTRRESMYQALIDQKQGQRGQIAEEMHEKEVTLNISQFGGSSKLTSLQAERADLAKALTEAQLRSGVASDYYKSLDSMIGHGQDPPEVVEALNRDMQVNSLRSAVINATLQVKTLTNDYGANSQQVKHAQDALSLYQEQSATAENNVRTSTRVSMLDVARRNGDAADAAVKSYQDKLKTIDSDINRLNDDFSTFEADRELLIPLDADLKLYNDLKEQTAQFTSLKDQTNLEWQSQPEASEIPSFPKLSVVMSLSISIGLLLSIGIAFAREFMDTTVRSPRDIARIGHMVVLGMVPHEDDDPQSRGTRLPLVIFEAPQSMMAEQLRQVRTRLQHAASLDTTRTILITSPGPDDGKSTIAANLASGLALNGRRILMVDANFRRPSVHRMFNLANDVGFSDVLNKLEMFETAVQETQVPNLYVLPSGLKPTNATELLESQLLIDFIDRALEEFDHVIFDSGPLLFVSETVALAPRVDGVVTVVRARANTRGVLQRLRDTLRQIKAEHLGVVLNAVRSTGGGYYRSNIRTYYDYQNDRAA